MIDGVEEARLTFVGATAGRTQTTYGVVDVGGGSTEFVIGGQLPDYAMSVDIGSVRLTERAKVLGLLDPESLRAYVAKLFGRVAPPYSPATVLGSGGTFVTLGAVHHDLTKEAAESAEHLVLSASDLRRTTDRLVAMRVPEIAELPGVVPARAGVLQAGAICAEQAAAHLAAEEVVVSVRDILDGLALHLAEEELASPAT